MSKVAFVEITRLVVFELDDLDIYNEDLIAEQAIEIAYDPSNTEIVNINVEMREI